VVGTGADEPRAIECYGHRAQCGKHPRESDVGSVSTDPTLAPAPRCIRPTELGQISLIVRAYSR
jgi:hypothetical protein